MTALEHQTLERLVGLGDLTIVQDVEGQAPVFIGAGKVHSYPLPPKPPAATPLTFTTLSSMARFVVANIDGHELDQLVLVATHDRVELRSTLSRPHNERQCYAVAVHGLNWESAIGQWVPLKQLVPMLGSLFEGAGDVEAIIDLLSSVKVSTSTEVSKNGLGWRAEAKEDLAGNGWSEVDRPYFRLHPFRMFPEAGDQPGSRMLVDVDVREYIDGKAVAGQITVADGDGWMAEAAEQVGAALEGLLTLTATDAGYDGPLPAVLR
ncbi:MAG: hypothetical protein AAGE94_08330 [Acidobacteriota bacterium]